MADTEPAGWLTHDSPVLVELWPGCVDLTDAALDLLLDSARTQCEAFAPALPDGADVPPAWLQAQALQARALSRAGVVGADDQVGIEGGGVTLFPMDWTVKNLLRPKRGRPVIA